MKQIHKILSVLLLTLIIFSCTKKDVLDKEELTVMGNHTVQVEWDVVEQSSVAYYTVQLADVHQQFLDAGVAFSSNAPTQLYKMTLETGRFEFAGKQLLIRIKTVDVDNKFAYSKVTNIRF